MINRSETAQRTHAKSRILAWADKRRIPNNARRTLLASVDAMLVELAARDEWASVKTIRFAETEGLSITLRANRWRVFPCGDLLSMTTVGPGWSNGWRQILRDEVAYDKLTWFLHYAEQYVHRGLVVKVLMAAWDRDRRVLHPFAPAGMQRTYDFDRPKPTNIAILDAAESEAKKTWGAATLGTRTTSVWVEANLLDPYLHQAVFHFLRGENLLRNAFELEAVVAFDCAMHAIKTLLCRGGVLTNNSSRSDLCDALDLGARALVASDAQFLRNKVGAHAGGWRWWDSGEITEELAPATSRLVRRALAKAARLEPTIRLIDPNPDSWSNWFLANFDTLWDAVWFDKD